jgi:hypothetical protein
MMNNAHTTLRQNKGFTLIELVVVMALFMTVIVISASAFNIILKNATQLFRSEESNIEGIVGLEMFRHDLQQSGYGLFTEPFTYASEAADSLPAINNDAPDNVPRPLVIQNNLDGTVSVDSNTPLAGTDYISIKGSTVGHTPAAQKWTFLNMTSKSGVPNTWPSAAENLASTDNVVVLRKQFDSGQRSTLIPNPTGGYSYTYGSAAFSNLSTQMSGLYTVYGINNAALRFPFNRTDYFVATPASATTLSSSCAPGTGVLYKATVFHSDGKLNYIPIMDCVLDMQAVLGWDTDGDGLIDTWSNADGSAVSGIGSTAVVQGALGNANNNSLSAIPNIRTNLKMIKVYILAQNGQKDAAFTSTSPLQIGDAGEVSLTRPGGLSLTTAQINYHWKLSRIVVRPKNLSSNQ